MNLQQIEEAASFANSGISDIDPSSIEEVTTATDEADMALQALQEAAAHAGADIANIDPSAMQQTAEGAEQASGSMEGMAGAAGLVEGAMSALIALGIVEFFDTIANSAGNLMDSWLRLSVAVGATADQVDIVQGEWGAAIDSMKENTGRSAGTIREHIINMGLAGVTSKDQIVSSFSAISGAAFATGVPLSTMENTFSRVVMMPNRLTMALRTMKISSQDVLNATGLSVEQLQEKFKELTPEARAAMLETIIGAKYGKRAVDAYKVSWEHLKDAAGAAFEALMQAIGKLVLPILIPAMDAMTTVVSGVASAINLIPGPVKAVFGALLSLAGIFAMIKLAIAPLLGLIGVDLGVALSSMVGLLTGSAEATGLLATALGPVGWAIAAIIGVIAGGIYIWTTWKEEVIALKDALISGDWGTAAGMIAGAFTYLSESIWNALEGIGDYVWNFFTSLPGRIGAAASGLVGAGNKVIHWIVEGLTSLSGWLNSVLQGMFEEMVPSAEAGGQATGEAGGKSLIDGLRDWIIENGPLIMDSITTTFMTLLPLIIQLIWQILTIIGLTLAQGAAQAGRGFVTGLVQWFQQLPSRVWGYLMQTLNQVAYWGGYMVGYAIRSSAQFLSSVLSFFMQLPGRVWSYLLSTLARIRSFASQAPSLARGAGSKIVSGLLGAIRGLPGLVWGILMSVANKLMSIGGTLYNAAMNLGAQIWEGFKAGLGIASPSYLERAMDQIIEKSHQMPIEMIKDAEALARINWQQGAPDFTATYNTSGVLTVKHEVDVTGAPPGNSNQAIADLILEGVKDRKVISAISSGLGKGLNQTRRATGA